MTAGIPDDAKMIIRDAREQLVHAISISSQNPPGNERPMAEYLSGLLHDIGAEVTFQDVEPDRPNVLGAFRFGPGPSFMLTAHTDTVPITPGATRDLLKATEEDGKLYGRGACDDKGPLIAMLAACRLAAQRHADGRHLAGTVWFAGVMGEESGGEGTRHLVREGPRPDAAVVGEPTELEPVLGHKGSYRKRFVFHGRAVHSSDPSLGENAAYHAARFVSAIEDLNDALADVTHPLFGRAVVSANVIQGGGKVIVVPDRCEVQVDRRLLPGETEDTAQREIDSILGQLRQRYQALHVDIGDLGMGKSPAELDREHPLAQKLKTCVEAATGRSATFGGYRAGTDMTFLAAAGVPTVIFGPGSISDAHTVDEVISLAEFDLSIEIYARLIESYLGGER